MCDVSGVMTPRLTLRDWRMEDAGDLASILEDPEVMRYSMTGPLDQSARHAWLVTRVALAPGSSLLGPRAMELKETGRVIGYVSIERTGACRGRHEAELGIRMARAYWDRGLAREAIQSLLAAAPRC